jgi:hypothetical protein
MQVLTKSDLVSFGGVGFELCSSPTLPPWRPRIPWTIHADARTKTNKFELRAPPIDDFVYFISWS